MQKFQKDSSLMFAGRKGKQFPHPEEVVEVNSIDTTLDSSRIPQQSIGVRVYL